MVGIGGIGVLLKVKPSSLKLVSVADLASDDPDVAVGDLVSN
jgi:hypothetical protein